MSLRAPAESKSYLAFAALGVFAALAGFAGAATAAGAAGAAGATAGGVFSAVRWSFSALISAVILALRSFNLTKLALIFAMAFAVLEIAGALAGFAAAFFVTGFAAALTAFAGAALTGEGAALGADFFAVAMIEFPFDLFGESKREKIQISSRFILASLRIINEMKHCWRTLKMLLHKGAP